MDPAHLGELIELEETYWWHVSKRRLVMGLLAREFAPPCRLVEGGVGSARDLLEFTRAGYAATGFDAMPESVANARARGLDVAAHDLERTWPVGPGSVDVVVLLDVLEHMADPVRVLAHVRTALRPGGGVVVTVPAYPFLHGDWDRALGHHRRYTARMLRAQVAEAGLEVERLTHWNAFSLPAALAVRGLARLLPRDAPPAEFPRVPPLVNRLLTACASIERAWLARLPLPVGLSLFAVLRRPAGPPAHGSPASAS
jgi:SAM-dependent methyltransferase